MPSARSTSSSRAPGRPGGVSNIVVTNAIGDSTEGPADAFTYVPVPRVYHLTPSGGATAGGTPVEIQADLGWTRDSFGRGTPTKMRFGAVEVPFTYKADQLVLNVVTPSHAAGPVPVIVEDENGPS